MDDRILNSGFQRVSDYITGNDLLWKIGIFKRRSSTTNSLGENISSPAEVYRDRLGFWKQGMFRFSEEETGQEETGIFKCVYNGNFKVKYRDIIEIDSINYQVEEIEDYITHKELKVKYYVI